MNPAAAEEYIASLYATVLKRDPRPDEFAHWVTAAAALPPEQVYFAFVNSKEYKLQREKSVPTKFPPGHYYSPIVDPSTIAEYVEKQYLQEPGDITGIHFDEDAMVRFWKENAEFIKNTPFSEHDDGKNRYYYGNDSYPYGDATMLRAMIAHFKPKNVIEVGSGFSSACMLDAVDHVGLSDFTMTCIDPDADRLRSRLREEDHSRVDIIERLVQDVPVSTFSKLNENDILFIDSTHVLKTASDVHYELFSILPSLNKGVLIHFHDLQYPFEYPRKWLFENNRSWNEIYALRAFLMYNSAFEVVFWNGLFARRQRELVHETNPLFLKTRGASIWLRARSADILQTQHAQIGDIHLAQSTPPAGHNRLRPTQSGRTKIEASAPANGYEDSMHSPVFIVGSPRSGTTALVDVLRHIGYHGFKEGNFLTLLHHIDAIVDRHYVLFQETNPGALMAHIDKRDLKRRLFETFRTVVNDLNPKEPWIDKSGNPAMILAIPIIRELWPGSVFVFAKRRGIENVISRMKKFPDESFEWHCVDWANNMAAWRTIRQQLPPGCFIEVEQRNMIQQPERTARSLCAFLQVDESAVPAACKVMSTPGWEESEKGSASKTLSLAESGWTVEQTETFFKHCETEMKEFGYTMDEHYGATL